jgi:hypothetical protein
MNRTQLEHIIRAASEISGDSEIVVVGSQAIHAQPMKLPPIAFQILCNANTGGATGLCVDAHDLALSKVGSVR